MMHFPNPNLDEGQSGDVKAMQMADLRGKIRKLIEGSGGYPDWSKAHEIGQSQIPTMAASTIINFAYGKTKKPSSWTQRTLAAVTGYKIIGVPTETIVPGSISID